jgi:hypothetical protein
MSSVSVNWQAVQGARRRFSGRCLVKFFTVVQDGRASGCAKLSVTYLLAHAADDGPQSPMAVVGKPPSHSIEIEITAFPTKQVNPATQYPI